MQKQRKGKPPRRSNMKCIKMTASAEVMRLSNADAQTLVNRGNAVYIPKHEYKQSC